MITNFRTSKINNPIPVALNEVNLPTAKRIPLSEVLDQVYVNVLNDGTMVLDMSELNIVLLVNNLAVYAKEEMFLNTGNSISGNGKKLYLNSK